MPQSTAAAIQRKVKSWNAFLSSFSVLLLATRKIVLFLPAGDLLFFQDLQEIPLDAVVRELRGEAQDHFIPRRNRNRAEGNPCLRRMPNRSI